jgi:DNA-binding NarL/FixJ family response regulator
MNTHVDVALILWNRDVIELVSLALLHRNLKSRGVEPSEGAERVESLIAGCSPDVVVFDLNPPYERSAATVQHMLERFPDCAFVMTCADSAYAVKHAPWLSRYHVFQKPYAVDDIANTVRALINRLPKGLAALSLGRR